MKGRTTRHPLSPRRMKTIRAVAEAYAVDFHKLFMDPKNRGPAFVWPDSLYSMTRKMAAGGLFQSFRYNAAPSEAEKQLCGELAEAKARELAS